MLLTAAGAGAGTSALALRACNRFAISDIISPPPDGIAGGGAAALTLEADTPLAAGASFSSGCNIDNLFLEPRKFNSYNELQIQRCSFYNYGAHIKANESLYGRP
jgi:hypothetical protein